MAKMLFDPPNFLVLDEPTNHLDMATKEMLMKSLPAGFRRDDRSSSPTTRHFPRAALSNRVLEVADDGAHLYGGGYTRVRGVERARGAGAGSASQGPAVGSAGGL